MEQMRERVARALCELQIRNARRFDTPADELEAKLPAAVEQAWQDFLPQADAALSLMQPEIDRRVAEEKANAADALTTLSARVETLEAALREVFLHGHSEGWRGNQTRRDVQPVDAKKSWSLYVSNGALSKTIARQALAGDTNHG